MEILIERYKNRIHLYSPYDAEIVRLAKEVLGKGITHYPDGRFEAWTFPLDWTTCLELREKFNKYLVLGPRLTRWAALEKRRQFGARALSKRKAIDLPTVIAQAPSLGAALGARTYQQVGAAFIAHVRNALLADEPGLGKTLQAMAAVVQAKLSGPILVLAPATALDITWAEELRRWLPQDGCYLAMGDRAKRDQVIKQCLKGQEQRRWLLCNFEMLRSYPKLLSTVWSTVVVDESQRLLICRSGKKEAWSLQRQGAGRLRVAANGLRLAMSGTPYRGKIENMWGTLNWLYPDKYTSFNRWWEKWFEYYTDTATGEVIFEGGIAPQKRKEFYKEIDAIILRRTKREVAKDMPPKMYAGWPLDASDPNSPIGVWLPMNSKQHTAYKHMVTNAQVALKNGELMANGVLAEMTRLKQFATTNMTMQPRTRRVPDPETGEIVTEEYMQPIPAYPSNKMDWLIEWMNERGIVEGLPGGKVIVASQFSKIVDLASHMLTANGIEHCVITGSVTGLDRKRAKNAFQNPEGPRVMLLSTKAGGVSLTLDLADDIIFFDETFDPDDQTQVEDRADRVSRTKHQVTVWYVRSLDTLEEAIATDNAKMDTLQHELQDGRRGVERAKAILAYRSKR